MTSRTASTATSARGIIFAPYVSGDRSPGGHGLGLVFCRLAAEAHGGRIWVEPNLPCGASFFVSLPQVA